MDLLLNVELPAALVLGTFAGWLFGLDRGSLLGRAAAFTFLGAMIAVFEPQSAATNAQRALHPEAQVLFFGCVGFALSCALTSVQVARPSREPESGTSFEPKDVASFLERVHATLPLPAEQAGVLKAAAVLIAGEDARAKAHNALRIEATNKRSTEGG